MFIPNLLFEILDKKRVIDFNDCSINSVTKEWLHSLCSKDFGFYSEDAISEELFPGLDMIFDDVAPITNSIIDFTPSSSHNLEKVFSELSDLLCSAIELRFFYPESFGKILSLVKKLEGSTITSVEVLVKYDDVLHGNDELIKFLQESKRIVKLSFHGAPADSLFQEESYDKLVIFYKDSILSSSHCGLVSPAFFSANLKQFTEAITYNSCLNRKISIDQEGNIKNCPSMNISYGKIDDTTLKNAMDREGFKDNWKITKNDISVCKDCEFRYMCQDCRAYIMDKKNNLSKPLKCNYDPYEAKWIERATAV